MRRLKSTGKKPTRTEQAFDALACAQAESSNRGLSPLIEMYEREHHALMIPEATPEVIMGEVVPTAYSFKNEDDYNVADAIATDVVIDTLTQPDINSVAVDASMARTRLLHDAGSLEVGLDLSQSIQAKNSMEKLFAHQMAVLHTKSMELMTKAADFPKDRPDLEIKMLNVACRMIDSYQRGMETLGRLRNGGKQTIVVKQVHVTGGQNIIADNVQGGGGNGRD